MKRYVARAEGRGRRSGEIERGPREAEEED
jgi:hypothetical protein